MIERRTTPLIIADERAEGSTESSETREPDSPLLAQHASSERTSRPALAETGLLSVLQLPGEGHDNSDVQDASRTEAETELAPQPAVPPRIPSVLIIEDTTELAEVIQATLERIDIHTAHESHGGRAFDRFNQMKPDIVLLDIALPDINGWKVLESIKERQRETGGKLPAVIVITAYGDPANRLVGKLQGVHSYLVKPFTSDEVERVVKEVLAGIRA